MPRLFDAALISTERMPRFTAILPNSHHAQPLGDYAAPRYSINLSVETLVDEAFPSFIKSELGGASDLARCLMLEIPLRDTLERPAEFGAAVSALTALGCGVAVSGVSHGGIEIGKLYEMGVRFVKFNSASALREQPNPDALDRMRNLGESCRVLGMKLIAESVERIEALGVLEMLKVEFAQGFALGEPRPL